MKLKLRTVLILWAFATLLSFSLAQDGSGIFENTLLAPYVKYFHFVCIALIQVVFVSLAIKAFKEEKSKDVVE